MRTDNFTYTLGSPAGSFGPPVNSRKVLSLCARSAPRNGHCPFVGDCFEERIERRIVTVAAWHVSPPVSCDANKLGSVLSNGDLPRRSGPGMKEESGPSRNKRKTADKEKESEEEREDGGGKMRHVAMEFHYLAEFEERKREKE